MERLDPGAVYESRQEGIPCPTEGCPNRGTRVRARFGDVRLDIPYVCADCEAEAEARRQEEERDGLVRWLMASSGVTPRMAEWSLDSYPRDMHGRRAARVARAWLEGYRAGRGDNLILHGRVGSGKTGLAWGVARDLIERDQTEVLLLNFRELLQEMRDAFRAGRRPAVTARAARVPVLVLDDLGAERVTDWSREELASLVERRYGAGLPTIVTTNYDLDELVERLGHDDSVVGERIASRLAEDAVMHGLRARDRRVRPTRA
jgi:DNA replication protein DnaC